MPTLEVEKSKNKLHPWVKILVLLMIAAIFTGIGWGVWQWRVSADKTAYEAAVTTQKLAGLTKNYDGAIAGWEKYRSRMWPRNYDYEAMLNEAGLLSTLRRDKDALALYRLAESKYTPKGTAIYEGIASISEQNGDYATAIKYYQKEEDVYAKMDVGTSERDWYHLHILMLKQKEQANHAAN